ncbi:hypothetical protein TSAR_014240 [Trichomalopsis sarcophagae]|uniref:Pacifastin domain-containing protein n=1 Tax=Trichomalopsis sarcophagae TaxID=543379 RepID=A0A232FKG7_9HYME|nr:hypothetical protein TSAR_014240 [Trichomalopsis sarcophagae]
MRTLFVVALAITAAAAENFCMPGSYFKKDCNMCSCSMDGKTAACTDMLCPDEMKNYVGVENERFCEPGKKFKLDDVSTCICTADGTMAECTLGVVPLFGKMITSGQSQYCTPGKMFSPDNCNMCKCSADGLKAMCTLKLCSDDNVLDVKKTEYSSTKQVCEPLTQFKDYCNTCFCSNDGLSFACTRMMCDHAIWNKDGSIKIVATTYQNQKKVCQAGSRFNDYCNTCFCNNDGTDFACTRMQCDKNIWNKDGSLRVFATTYQSQKKVCQAGSRFNDYCNICFCNNDGTDFACTRMQCDENIWNKDGSMKVLATTYQNQKKVCQAGSRFNDYCNTCFCNEDGTSFACTRMQCDENIWNKDGSMKVLATTYDNQKKVCQAGTKFNDYCNTCFCNEDGTSFACTRMMCDKNIWNKDGSLKNQAVEPQVCKPNTHFMEYCNICACSEDGTTYGCTMMNCDLNVWNKDGSRKDVLDIETRVCEPNTHFNEYCNTCTCSADGMNKACTMMNCDLNIWNKDGSRKDVLDVEPRVCQPNTQFKEYCNTCACSADGTNKACTMMDCDLDMWNKDGSRKDVLDNKRASDKVCQPGKAFSPDGCNTCVCNEYGTQLACTSKLCMTTLKQAYGVDEAREWGPVYKQGDACTPGKSFYSECNQCVCLETGNRAFCTLMDCAALA